MGQIGFQTRPKWLGASPPPFWKGLEADRARLDTQHRRFPAPAGTLVTNLVIPEVVQAHLVVTVKGGGRTGGSTSSTVCLPGFRRASILPECANLAVLLVGRRRALFRLRFSFFCHWAHSRQWLVHSLSGENSAARAAAQWPSCHGVGCLGLDVAFCQTVLSAAALMPDTEHGCVQICGAMLVVVNLSVSRPPGGDT